MLKPLSQSIFVAGRGKLTFIILEMIGKLLLSSQKTKYEVLSVLGIFLAYSAATSSMPISGLNFFIASLMKL